MTEREINKEYNRIFGADTWQDNKDMYLLGAYFIEPNFNHQMGGFSAEERDKWLPQYNDVDNGKINAFEWLKEHGKIASDVIFALDEKGNYKSHAEYYNGEYYIFDNTSADGLELDIYVATKADALRVFNGEW